MKFVLPFIFSANLYAAQFNTLQGNVLPPPSKSEIEQTAERIKIPAEVKVPESWLPYLNPAFEEFWNEGNHHPDAGFVLFARNPSVENAKLWLIRMETKAKYLQVMLESVTVAQKELIKKGLLKDRYGTLTQAKSLPKPPKQTHVKEGMSALEIYFLFSSTCSHCKRMAATLTNFPNVSPLQVDSQQSLTHFEGLPPTEVATESTKKEYLKTGEVPTLVLHDPETKTVNILKGNQPKEQILLAMSLLLSNRGEKK